MNKMNNPYKEASNAKLFGMFAVLVFFLLMFVKC